MNEFYSEFDFERLKLSNREHDYRTPFQIDRDRIIHSSEFRRLQGKTQVFLPGEYDFYRTRLTHSIEAAQIGRSICSFLKSEHDDLFSDDYFIDSDLVESACLAHDLGHPPFGHSGERTLHKLMKPFGGFEGNPQTLRLITEIFYKGENERRGMNPCRAFLDGVMKYKNSFSELGKPDNQYIYDYQKEFLKFLYGAREIPADLRAGEALNGFRSIECQIMDWADDTAYAVNDIVDSINGGFLTIAKLSKWGRENESSFTTRQKEELEKIISWVHNDQFKPRFGSQIGEFITACNIKERQTFMDSETNRYKYRLNIHEEVMEKAAFYKRISVELVFQTSQLHQMEHKGNFMIEKIFNLLADNYVHSPGKIKLLPGFTDGIIRREEDADRKIRLICDYIAGMTDSFALRNYRRLFDPDYSSLADLI